MPKISLETAQQAAKNLSIKTKRPWVARIDVFNNEYEIFMALNPGEKFEDVASTLRKAGLNYPLTQHLTEKEVGISGHLELIALSENKFTYPENKKGEVTQLRKLLSDKTEFEWEVVNVPYPILRMVAEVEPPATTEEIKEKLIEDLEKANFKILPDIVPFKDNITKKSMIQATYNNPIIIEQFLQAFKSDLELLKKESKTEQKLPTSKTKTKGKTTSKTPIKTEKKINTIEVSKSDHFASGRPKEALSDTKLDPVIKQLENKQWNVSVLQETVSKIPYRLATRTVEAKEQSFYIYSNKLTTHSEHKKTFKAMLLTYRLMHGDTPPRIKTTEKARKDWEDAYESVYGNKKGLDKIIITDHKATSKPKPTTSKPVEPAKLNNP